MTAIPIRLAAHDALLIVDVQNDFLPGGSLAVAHGDEILPVLRRYLALFESEELPIFASRDWHPADHCSFRAQGGRWPPHCLAGSTGAAAPAELPLPRSSVVVHKATAADRDAYSAFEGTSLADLLRARGVRRLFVGGLATDYCVLETVRDAVTQGYDVVLLRDAIRAVNVHPDDGSRAEAEMLRVGALPVRYEELTA